MTRENVPSLKTVEWIALLTVLTSTPLLLSFNIKYSSVLRVCLTFFTILGGLLSVFVPALVLLGFATTIRIWLLS